MKSEMSHAQRLYSPGRIGVAGRGQRRRRDTLGWTAAPPHLEEGLVALVTVVHVRAPKRERERERERETCDSSPCAGTCNRVERAVSVTRFRCTFKSL